ncbi:MAG: glycosyltransferase [bacterium]
MKSLISLVIPCYNEESNIPKVLKDANRALDHVSRMYEIVVVNDGSSDKTLQIVEEIAAANNKVKIVTHLQNEGYGAAVMSGLKAAQGDYILMVDGDGQFDMRELSYIIKGLKYADIVIGYRLKRSDQLMRKINSLIFNWSVRIFFGLWVKDLNCSMKGFQREVVERLEVLSLGALINADILTQSIRKGMKVVQVPVHHFPRTSGNPTGGNLHVIMKSLYEYSRLFIREFPLRWKEFTFKQRTAIGFVLAVIMLLFSKPVFGLHFAAGLGISLAGLLVRNWAGGYLKKTKELACSGPYAYVRHPLYSGSVLLSLGFCFMISNAAYVFLTILFWILFLGFFIGVYRLKIAEEEKHLKKIFQEEYDLYIQKVPRYIPLGKKYTKNQRPFDWGLWRKNKEYNSIIGFSLALIILLIKLRS